MVIAGKHERLGRRYGRLVGVIFFVLALTAVAIIVLQFTRRPVFRQTGILVGDPMIVFSWDGRGKTLTLLTIPADTTVTGVHGSGEYTLDALWQLGRIDLHQRALLAQSIEDALGLPVPWYLASKSETQSVKQIFSLGNAFSYLKRDYDSNIPVWLFFQWSWEFSRLRPDKVVTIPLVNARSDVAMPDSTVAKVLDLDRTDNILSNSFEDDRLRSEALRTEVLNTTGTPTLGNRIGRLLGHMGVSVVSVGNDTPAVPRCQLFGSEQSLGSLTAAFIFTQYHCEKKLETESGKADLVLKIGRELETYFTQN